ncbi:hypothetical protein ASPZODRAFT_62718 [Penicilliopsis zonata CBS 506.65]|uniref:Uncharacterized protein n=1 Tax=Penicilliopsis zonata CBS 506.65 TaxID=1073090 RepID=A0A1L9SN82_9EURO|nr:hypothetical protein ASPZODRAFT_62718 [Penicilliopsis zonata CBS 506.65]OJJ48722.1 hypothetical protein ASPZODRAFT_62718 [Penicilliopsis zonata CBS 506.65]
MADQETDQPSTFNYVLSFLLVGVAWGFTTPFIRRAAADFNARQEAKREQGQGQEQDQTQAGDSGTEGTEEQELMSVNEESDAETTPAPGEEHTVNADDRGDSSEEDNTLPTPAWKKHASPPASSWVKTRLFSLFWTVVNLLRTPAYLIPLVINLTGSIWFFILVGKHELSLTVPLSNSSAFLFTVLGEWYVERKVIARETWLGMFLVLGGIALCVYSKNQSGNVSI